MEAAGVIYLEVLSAIGFTYLGARWGLLWRTRRHTKRQGFYGYPFLQEIRPNTRRRLI